MGNKAPTIEDTAFETKFLSKQLASLNKKTFPFEEGLSQLCGDREVYATDRRSLKTSSNDTIGSLLPEIELFLSRCVLYWLYTHSADSGVEGLEFSLANFGFSKNRYVYRKGGSTLLFYKKIKVLCDPPQNCWQFFTHFFWSPHSLLFLFYIYIFALTSSFLV